MKLITVSVVMVVIVSFAGLRPASASTGQMIRLDGTLPGRTYEGIGAVSAGASSRLLIDYLDPYRSQILDYLFKPNFGAALQHLKVEIGGDTNSTDGSEPSFAHKRADMANPDFTNCYELWLAREARKRNSSIYLDALQWGAPGWIGNGKINSQDNADYLVKFLQGAKAIYGLDFNYIGGCQNERYNGTEDVVRNYIVNNLRPALNSNGFRGVGIVAGDRDGKWKIADRMTVDAEYKKAVAALGGHYPGLQSTDNARKCGIPIWVSETWGWDIDGRLSNESDVVKAKGWHKEAALYAKLLNRNYIDAKCTKSEIWAPVFACLPGLPYDATGLIKCREPWSGNYEIRAILWAVAHTTQFAAPGWQYLDGTGCGSLTSGGSYVTLKTSDGKYSVVIETYGATATQSLTFTTAGLSTEGKDIWTSTGDSDLTWFQKKQTNVYKGSDFTISNIAPDSIVTVTTWRNGQSKGAYSTPPASAKFPFPYSEDFESYSAGATPKYLTDMQGTFEVVQYPGESKSLRQVVTAGPINWICDTVSTLFGDPTWDDYGIKADFYLENAGEAGIIGRGHYAFDIHSNGSWSLCDTTNKWVKIASGAHSVSTGSWHTVAMNFSGSSVQLFIDNMIIPVSSVDIGRGAGMVRLFAGNNYNNVRFDNLSVGSASIPVPASKTISYGPGVVREWPFDDDWQFLRDDAPGAEKPGYDEHAWRTLDLPHDWSIEDLPASNTEAKISMPDVIVGPFAPNLSAGGGATGHVVGGIGWYRKRFILPETVRDRKVAIEFDGIYMDSDVWINGIHLGNHPYGYTSFTYDLTPHLAPAGSTNVLAVRVRNQGKNSRWYSGSGIYRHVRLVVTDAARIGHWGVAITTPQVSAESAMVQFAVRVDNGRSTAVDGEIRVRLCQADGKETATATAPVHVSAGASGTAEKSITLASPQLWSDTDPKLYRAEILLVVGGAEVDRTSVPFGIRSIVFDAEHGFRLNGVTVKLKGACLHHENGPLGSVAIDRAEERRVELLKANGFNAIRCAHNPPSPYFLEVCDRLGMLVVDEAFDAWNYGKNTDDYSRYFKDWWRKDIDSLVLRDRNHPCVIMWSVGNEIPEQGSPEGAETCAMLAQAVRKIDPTRFVTVANNQATEKSDSYFSAVDVCGYNYHLERYDLDHKRLPKRVIYASESFPTQPYDHWKGVTDHAWVIGDFVWSGFDYMGESGGGSCVLDGENEGFPKNWPWYIVNCGDIDLCGFKRVPSYCRDVVWGRSKLEMAVHRPLPPGRREKTNGWGWPDELRSWTWPGQEGKSMQVRVFTSGDQVRLMLNNKEVGRANVPESSKQIATFQVPYAPGTLRAVALSNGVELASQELVTTGAPRGIRLTADRSAIRADRNDLSFITVEIVDEDGRLVPDAQVKVRFAVSGPGELAAVGSGDPKGPASFRQPERLTFHGRCLAILRPVAGAGAITLRAECDGLAKGNIAVAVQ